MERNGGEFETGNKGKQILKKGIQKTNKKKRGQRERWKKRGKSKIMIRKLKEKDVKSVTGMRRRIKSQGNE